MVQLLFFKTFLVLLSYVLVSCASIQTENLGHLNLLTGLAGRLYTTSLTGYENAQKSDTYFENREFLADSQLVSQRIVTSLDGNRLKYENNHIFGFYYDPNDSYLVVELKGYIKAPADGQVFIEYDLNDVLGCDGKGSNQSFISDWLVSTAVSLNNTENGFVCSYDQSSYIYSDIWIEGECDGGGCSGNSPIYNVKLVNEQYYPVTIYFIIAGDAFNSDLTFYVDNLSYNFDNCIYYDPNDNPDTNSSNDNTEFPDVCPQFHEEIFTEATFVEPTSIYPDECPLSSISSSFSASYIYSAVSSSLTEYSDSESSASTVWSNTVPSSLPELSSSVPPSSIGLSSSVRSSSMQSSTTSQFLSIESDNSFSSAVSSSSSSMSQVSSDSYSMYSSIESQTSSLNSSIQTTESSSTSTSEITTSADTLLSSSRKSYSFTSAGGKSIYTASSVMSNSQDYAPTSRVIVVTSSSSANAETSENSDNFSTAEVTKSETDTYTTTTCPETEYKGSKNAAHPSLLVSNVQPELTRNEAALLGTQATTTDGVIKITAEPVGPTITYSECASCASSQEIGIGVSDAESKLTENSFRSTNLAEHTHGSAVIAGVPVSGIIISYGQSTSATVQTFSDEGHSSTYQPLLLVTAILMTFL